MITYFQTREEIKQLEQQNRDLRDALEATDGLIEGICADGGMVDREWLQRVGEKVEQALGKRREGLRDE